MTEEPTEKHAEGADTPQVGPPWLTVESGLYILLVVLAGAAEMERNLTRERTRSALAVKRASGQRIGTVPYGYDLGPDGASLIPNESERAVIAEIRAMRRLGMKLQSIAKELTRREVPTKTCRSTRWSHQAIARILARSG